MSERPPVARRRGRLIGWCVALVVVVAVGGFALGRGLAHHDRGAERDTARQAAAAAAERYATRLGDALRSGRAEVHEAAFPQIDRIGYRASAGRVEVTFESVQVVSGTTVQADDVARCYAIRSPATPAAGALPLAEIDCSQLLPLSPDPTSWTVPSS